MKAIVDRLSHYHILCKRLTAVAPKELGSRKKISLYVGVDTAGYYCSVMHLVKKSRVLRKEAEELIVLHGKLEMYQGTTITKKYIQIEAPLCSKAKAMMEQAGWMFV